MLPYRSGQETKKRGSAGSRGSFEALPKRSSPATPVKKPVAYDKLKVDFSSPLLPYSQPLDICRSYLRQLRTNRYAAMRRFRKDITECPDPANEPAAFQRHLWRYPVRIEIAREHLSITPEEYDLYAGPRRDRPVASGSYGFDSDPVDGELQSSKCFTILLCLNRNARKTH